MIASIIGALLPVALQIVGYIIERSKLSEEAKKRFFEFAKKAGEDTGSTKLMQYGDAQLEWMAKNPWKEGVN